MSDYFEHVLNLPLTFHSNAHSGTSAEDHARRRVGHVRPVAVVLSRELRLFRRALRAAAGDAVRQLAARRCCSSCSSRSSISSTSFVLRRTQRAAGRGRAPQFLPRRTCFRRARQYSGGAELHAHRERNASRCGASSTICSPRRCRSSPGGRWSRSPAAPRRR